MQLPPIHTRLFSYFFPQLVRKTGSNENALLELYYYRGRWQLATLDALYSDGDRYRPLLLAYKQLKKELPSVKNVLVLGTGLGSAVQIMHKKGYYPFFTLVDIDKVVLQWTLELLANTTGIEPVCADAGEYMHSLNKTFDLLIVDVFMGRVVPAFVTAPSFIQNVRRSVNPGGHFVLNYIVNDEAKWQRAEAVIAHEFPKYTVKSLGVNRIVIAQV